MGYGAAGSMPQSEGLCFNAPEVGGSVKQSAEWYCLIERLGRFVGRSSPKYVWIHITLFGHPQSKKGFKVWCSAFFHHDFRISLALSTTTCVYIKNIMVNLFSERQYTCIYISNRKPIYLSIRYHRLFIN